MKILFSLCFAISFSFIGFTQSVRYYFEAPNAAHHEAEINVTADKLPAGPAIFRMSRSSPGRYATHEFGKNVYNVKAFDAKGKQLSVEKADADVYKVLNHQGTVKLTYTLFGNHADGTYASIDPSGYHLNMPATFMWVKGFDQAPITIEFKLADPKWKIATQLKPTSNPTVFTAPDLQYFMDSPTKIGDLFLREWSVKNTDGTPITFRLALDADAPATRVDSLVEKLKIMVQEARGVFGEFPSFDYGTYTFIASINPYVRGDGMEHRNSTMIASRRPFTNIDILPGVFSHEFFHCWNVERIRPKSLEPFNFEKSNMSEALWVAEGFTQYYGDLILVRAGLLKEESFLGSLTSLINTKMNTPGGQNYSPIENSQRAVFVDAGVAIDQTNYSNMYASYYPYGGAIALALDLELRSKYQSSLDVFMRALWKRHGKPEKPYTVADLQAVLATITNTNFAQTFFTKYVYGHEPFDYQSALENAGFQLKKISDKPWVGSTTFSSDNANALVLMQAPQKNTPLYETGIDAR